MPKDAAFTMKLEPELRDAFVAAAEAAHQPASQVVRQLMREYVARQAEDRAYEAFLRAKVATARRQADAGDGVPNSVVAAEFQARRSGQKARD